jgi:NAD(P)-dependent dehydrogenase (short-subunit alcohol dehydrogenase family)
VQILAVGAALGMTATAGVALLLYTGGGFLRAAGFLIAVALAAAAAGLWAGRPAGDARARRPWIWTVASLVLAGAFTIGWSLSSALRQSGLGNALAVLLIVAGPGYAVGTLVGPLAGRRPDAAPLALAGVALGVVVAAAWVIPRAQAPAVFAAAATTVLAAGLLGWTDEVDGLDPRRDDMHGKVAIVTGVGARGQVGYAIATRFLRAGAQVIITGRKPAVEELARDLEAGRRGAEAGEGGVTAVVADLLSDEDVDRLMAVARDRFGRLDALINVAGGLSVIKPIAETSPDEWRREIERNAETTLRTCRAALPLLRETGGSIVNFAAPAGLRAVGTLGAYSAAKAAVVALTRALALEERNVGVRANAIAPGMIDTEQNRDQAANPEKAKYVTREEIAEVALFLAGDASSGISGETIHVMGDSLR